MKITFYPDIDKNDLGNGVCVTSEIGWQSLHEHLEKAFGVDLGERLVGIEVRESGIKAFFKRNELRK